MGEGCNRYGQHMLKTADGTSAIKGGVLLTNIQGDVHLILNTIEAAGLGVSAGDATNANMRLFLYRGHIKTTGGSACVDVRGVALLALGGGLAVERVGGGSAITVTVKTTPTPASKLVYHGDSITYLKGTPILIYASITMIEGQMPPSTSASRASATQVAVGSRMYETTLNKPLWSDGTNCRDATSATV
jgi:hypothetical protein